MKNVKYFLLLMSSCGHMSGAEQQSVTHHASFSVLSMANRTDHTYASQAFFNDLVTSCEVNVGQRIWATCSQSTMQGELWTVRSDNTMITLGSITPPQDFGLSGSVKNIKLHKIMDQVYFVAHDKQGVLLYALNSEARTLLDQGVRALSKFAGAVGTSVSSAFSTARETARSSPGLPHSVVHSSVSVTHRALLSQVSSDLDPLENRRWFLTPILGGSVFIQNEIRDIVRFEEGDDSGIMILHKLGSSITGEDFSSLLHYIGTKKDRCLASPCSSKWDTALKKAGFTLLQNVSAMKSNGNNGIIFGGTGKVGGSFFVGMSNNVKSPQTLFTLDIAEGGIPQQLPIHLVAATIALLHHKNTPHTDMVQALQSLLADKKKTLAEVTSNYAIMSSGSSLEQVGYNKDSWSTGKFILLHAGRVPNIFSDGSVLEKKEHDKASFYFFPTDFIPAEADSSVGDLSEVMAREGMVPSDLRSALDHSDLEDVMPSVIDSAQQDLSSSQNAAKEVIAIFEGAGREEALLQSLSTNLLSADSPALMQSVLAVPAESASALLDELQEQVSPVVDASVVQDDEEPAQDLSAKEGDGKKKKKKPTRGGKR